MAVQTMLRHLVKKYESAGIAAISIEDKIFPKQNSLLENGTHQLLPEKDFVGKIITANEAKQNKEFMIIARVEALIAGLGMNEAIRRAQAYEKAGADAILIHSKKSVPDEIFEFVDSWKGDLPIVVVPTNFNSVKINELIQHKIKMTIYANHTLRAAHAAVTRTLNEMIKLESLDEIKEEISSMDDIFQLQEMYDLKAHEDILEEKFKELGYDS